MRHYITIIILLLFVSSFAQTDNTAVFNTAGEYYQKGAYEDAIRQYETILNNKLESGMLYYNLANAHYKLNHVPESIYYYEKALKLNPDNIEAKKGLQIAQQMTIDVITPLPKTWLQQLSGGIIGLFSLQTWAVLSIIGVMAFVLSFLCYYFVEQTALKRLFFTLLFISILFTIGTYSIAHYSNYKQENEVYAILFDKTIKVFTEANAYSTEVIQLHEGTKVSVTERMNDWVKIRLADGKIGWVKENTLKIL
ncbi:SH3 domain-containing protein [Capnocytophaga sp. oral taxon 878]|uniref:SH3 domain-containing protein n=1 Tax=Capnocytophaga sp. oral taxon 878 TaxID=1316596 RepID=UPI000D024C4A|nr:tetratricopeptide repeat protein [Capnocytophaga sp. oral taxon 878]AVM49373.1 hypothetical protein C4H12_02215 [Capnocytophaga sp. oral taxon 878]